MSRVLLTGAAGFIGSHLTRRLLAEGHDVTVVLRPGDDRRRLAGIESRLSAIEGDLADLPRMVDRLKAPRPDICIHLAWQGWKGTAEDNLASLGASLQLLRAMPAVGCSRFVTAGTCYEYDLSSEPLAETMPLKPREVYGACKKALYELGQQFADATGMSAVTTRIFYTYGPSENRAGLVPSVIRALLRDEPVALTPGTQVRDFVHVDDIASAIWTVARSDARGAVNIASGEPVTVAEIARSIAGLLQKPELIRLGALPHRAGEPMHVVGDATRLRRELGWSPRFTIATGLADTIEWWRSQVAYV